MKGRILFDDCDSINISNKELKIPQKTTVHVENLREIERRIEGPIDIFGYATLEMNIDKLVKPEKN